uniref:Tower domain-containing protein n=1 Tax=Gouania willdenowi TaxID=441366 RepID=A0A8C5ELJ8_GOUWI
MLFWGSFLELGPLDPNWFDILSRQASAEEGNASDQDELCANQEGNFKVPSDKTGLNSQPFSTPKVFRHRRVVSPHTQDDTFTAKNKVHPLCVSIKQVSHAKCISESLGAQINPDISWTSSLNTPPAVPSTLILSKGCTTVLKNALHPEDSSHNIPQPSSNQTEEHWQQKLPDAIKDGEIRNAITSVLDGAENALSIFFANSSSALRKVKPVRIQRKQIVPTKEHSYSSQKPTTTSANASSTKEKRSEQKSPGVPVTPPTTSKAEPGMSQWSPLSLSQIPAGTADISTNNTCGSPPCLKPIIHSTPPFQSTTKEILQNDYNVLIEETPQHSELDSERSCDIRTQSTSPQQRAISNPPSLPLKADVSHSYPHTSGFKTASNKGITISLSNLAKAKILLEETENQTSVGQPAKCGKAIQHKPLGTNAPVKDKTCKSNVKLSPKESRNDSCPLTASQKADVTELCTLLEEANSQFEFTQFKTTVIKQQAGNTSSQTLDKELDSDLLTGIDFDDSFSSNAQKDMTMTIMPKKKNPVMDITSCEISDAKRKPPEEPKKEISSIGVDIVSQDMCSPSSTKTRYPQRNEQAELSESDNDYAMLKGGFKTAGENVLRVSKKCLFKARNLFADLEERPTYRKIEKESKVKHNLDFNKGSESPKVNPKGHVEQVGTSFSDEQVLNLESEAALIFGSTSLNGFQLASGKAISVSAKHLEQANDLFKEFGVFENGCSAFGREGNCNKSPAKSSNGKKLSKLKNVVLSMKSIAEKKAEGVIAINDKPSLSNAISIHGNLLTNSTSPPFYPTTKDSESSAIEQLNNKDGICLTNVEDATMSNNGFVAASGKSVTLSSEALQKARALFNDISLDSTTSSHTKRRDEKQENIPKVNCGYMTVAGKKVPVSKKNLRKSKPFFKAFDKAGSPEAMAEMEAFIKNRNVPSELCSSTVYNEETEKRCTENTGKLKMENLNTLPRQNIGFQTASGKGVTISSEALKKAKSLLSECEKCNDANTISSEEFKKRQTPLKECEERVLKSGQPSSSSSGLPAADNSQVTPSLEPILKHKDLFRDVNLKTDFSTDTLKYDENQAYPGHLRRVDFGFTTAKGAKISVSHKGLLKARHLMKDFEESVSTHFYEKDEFKEDHETIFEKGCNDDMLSMVKGKPTHMSLHNCGFKTAAGKGVNISFNALEKAKTLLGEHEWQKDKIGVNPPQNITVVSQSCPPCSSNGFLAASDKQLAVSSKALHKAKALFSDIHFTKGTKTISHCLPTDLQKFIELARDMQDMRIQKKKRQTIRPLPGSLFLTKTSGVERVPLKVAVNRIPPGKYTSKQLYSHGVHNHVSEVSSETAESFRFSLLQYFKKDVFADNGGVQLGDGGWLIPSNDGTAGKEEFYRALCDTPGVDPKLISEAWVYNHYRWIVWKQASMERCFPEVMGSLCLTPEQVLLQLKYRYDVEVDHSRRPALRKITEKDDTAAKTLVLCVCGIVTDGLSTNEKIHNDAKTPQGADPQSQSPAAVIWLTDGWYAIKAQLDKPLTAMVHRGRLAVGGKLMVHGAQLVGSQDACPPLEAPESLMLKICANSCRPVRWDVKLGFYKDPRPFLLPVSCLYSDGGPVGCVDIIILRSYPIQWMERTPDGVVFRSIRAEEKEARQYNTRKHIAMEALFAKLQAEFEQEEKGRTKGKSTRRRQTLNRQDIASLQDGEELYEAVGDDPAHLQAHLSEQQLEILQSFRRSLMDKKQAELQDRYRRALEVEGNEGNELSFPKRDVTTVWRLCFTDAVLQSIYQLNLWRPPSDVQSLLKEGSRYKVYNLSTTEGKKRSCVESLQFTGTKKTRFEEMQASQEWISTRFQHRVSTSLVTFQNSDFQPLCGEVDLTGFVVSIVDGLGTLQVFFYLQSTFSGLEDVVKPGVLLALSNLQLKGQSLTIANIKNKWYCMFIKLSSYIFQKTLTFTTDSDSVMFLNNKKSNHIY